MPKLRAIAAGDRTPERVARADVALTVSFFRLLSDLHRGRVSPERAGFKFSPGDKRSISPPCCKAASRHGPPA